MDFSFKHKCDHERHHRPRSKILIKTLFDKRAEKAKAHEKMSGEILFQKGTSETESNETLSQVKQRNFIGRLVGRKRNQLGWTQDVFADKLQFAGWHDATRSTVSKIEPAPCGLI